MGSLSELRIEFPNYIIMGISHMIGIFSINLSIFIMCSSSIFYGYNPYITHISMGFPWDFHGISMGFTWDFHPIPMGFPSQVVTLELRSLEQRLSHGSVSAGAMDEANEAMAKVGRTLGDFSEKVGGRSSWSSSHIYIYNMYICVYIYIYILGMESSSLYIYIYTGSSSLIEIGK